MTLRAYGMVMLAVAFLTGCSAKRVVPVERVVLVGGESREAAIRLEAPTPSSPGVAPTHVSEVRTVVSQHPAHAETRKMKREGAPRLSLPLSLALGAFRIEGRVVGEDGAAVPDAMVECDVDFGYTAPGRQVTSLHRVRTRTNSVGAFSVGVTMGRTEGAAAPGQMRRIRLKVEHPMEAVRLVEVVMESVADAATVYEDRDESPLSGARREARETDWIRNPMNGHLYRVIEAGTWEECEKAAQAQDAHLVTVNGPDEQEWLVETFGGDSWFWIGMSDAHSEGDWQWASGEPVTFTNWSDPSIGGLQEPNNLWSSGEHFAHMNWIRPGGLWNDLGTASPEWRSVRHGIIEKADGEEATED